MFVSILSRGTENHRKSEALAKVCVTICILTLTLGADSEQLAQPSETLCRQNLLMQKSLNKRVLLQVRGGTSTDVCTWKQTECTDGIVTAIWASKLPNYQRIDHSIKMEWLPPTLQFIHVKCIPVPNLWTHMCLPRDLKYLLLMECNDLDSAAEFFNLARIPRKMEELILIDSNVRGMIRLVGLPDSMRFVFFRVFNNYVKSITVDYNSLPETLKGLHASTYEGPSPKVIAIGKAAGTRLNTKSSTNAVKEGSLYFEAFHKKLG